MEKSKLLTAITEGDRQVILSEAAEALKLIAAQTGRLGELLSVLASFPPDYNWTRCIGFSRVAVLFI